MTISKTNVVIPEGKWLWDCADVQNDLNLLKEQYKKQLGYDLSKIQCFNVWYIYCDYCSANWMYVDCDLANSEWAVKKVLDLT